MTHIVNKKEALLRKIYRARLNLLAEEGNLEEVELLGKLGKVRADIAQLTHYLEDTDPEPEVRVMLRHKLIEANDELDVLRAKRIGDRCIGCGGPFPLVTGSFCASCVSAGDQY